VISPAITVIGVNERRPAEQRPIARVLVDVPLPHLDRPFDYRVQAAHAADAVPGCRVKVRFAGQLVQGYLLDRVDTTEHVGRLAYLERVISPEPVLSPELAAVARAVADRYAGTVADVLRLAVPPRHARVEAEASEPAARPQAPGVPTQWQRYERGAALVKALSSGVQAKAVWQALPNEDWPRRLAELAATVAAAGRSAVIVVPDHRDVARVHAACVALMSDDAVVALSADLGPARRYRRWLRVRRGAAHVVVGTRAAMFAPVHRPGLFVVWDDGDDLHAEPRAPYPHVRDVLVLRAHQGGASFVAGGFARTAEAQLLVESGWAHEVIARRSVVREHAPRVSGTGDDFEQARDPAANTARLPAVAFEAARAALDAEAPVLVQVPRRGYVPALACAQCRTPARCRRCAGPLGLPAKGSHEARPPACRWCGAVEPTFRCAACGSARLRAQVVGAGRTAEELGRAFPGTTVRTSGGDEVLATVPSGPQLVVATPGAEPVVEGGFGAALLLDGWALLGRPDLRAAEETLRRWMTAAAMVRPADQGGRVVVGADTALRTVQALIRWDPAGHAQRELAEREELGFPPARRMASVQGVAHAVAKTVAEIDLPASAEVLGPVPVHVPRATGDEEHERALIRVPRGDGKALAAALARVQAQRTARKEPDSIRVQLDPLEVI